MFVTKRNGSKEEVLFDKITERIKKLINKKEEKFINATLVGQKVVGFIHSGITTEELDVESAKICVNLCTTHPLYSNLGGRILVSNLQKKTLDSFSETVMRINSDNNFYDQKFYKWVMLNSKELDDMIDYSRDYQFDYFGFKTLERAYLIKNQKTGYIYERPQHMWMRVAAFLNQDDLSQVKKTYDLLSSGYYTHASPTLFNSANKRSQLSSCFLLGTGDSMDDITNTWKSLSSISKWGGGIGVHVSNIRAKDSLIRGTNGPSSGIIPMLQVYNSIARYVNQCFIGETKIYTDKGLVAIKDLKVGDNVYTNDGTLKNILKIYNDNYDKNVLDIKIMHNFEQPTSVTPEHPFYVIKNQKKGTNYSVITNRLEKELVEHEWVEAKNLTENDLICIPIPKYEKDFTSYSDSDCYIYGIMLGDGHICNNRNEAGITLGKNKKHIKESLIKYLELHTINYWESENESTDFIRWTVSSKFKFTRNQLYDKDNLKKIDDVFLNLPIEKSKWIVKGLLDTDGCISKELTLELTSQQVIESVKYILLRMGILTSGYSRDRVGNVSSYKNITTRLPTWVLRIPKTPEISRLLSIEESKFIKFFRFGDNLYTRLESIEERKIDEIVYDLEIESNHNYLTEVGLVHNGGKRKGSIAVYLEPHHPDIFEFLDLRKNFGDENMRARDLFLALWISDLFMKQVENDDDWYLMCPDECPGLNDVWGNEYEELFWKYVHLGKFNKKIKARELMKAIWESQQETGTPYITYKDHVNRKSNQQNIGTIKSSNLCNEIVEYSDKDEHAVCNLASIALNKMIVPFDMTNKEFIIHTKPECKYCRWAKNFMESNDYEYKNIIFDADGITNSQLYIEELKNQISNYNITIEKLTFPQIFLLDKISGEQNYIGGFEDMFNKIKPSYDHKKLYDVAYTATMNLNNVIDINYYPTKETKRSNMRHRPIGLGIQGLADTLVQMRIPFDSEESLELNAHIMETIYFASMTASKDISKKRNKDMKILMEYIKENDISIPEYYDSEFVLEENNDLYHKLKPNTFETNRDISNHLGSYSTFEGSPVSKGIFQFDMWGVSSTDLKYNWDNLKDEVKIHGIRNSLLVALMPTASTSQILGNNECFEFFTSNIYTRNTLAGDFPLINRYMVNDLLSIGEWNTTIKDLIIAGNGSIQHIKTLPESIRRLYQTQWELKQIWVLKAAKARGPFVDQTQSMNIFMEEPNDQKLNSCLFWGWKNGLKSGIYYLRSKPSSNAIKFTIDPKLIQKMNEDNECEMCSA